MRTRYSAKGGATVNTYIVTITGNDTFRAVIKVRAASGIEANEKAASWMEGKTTERLCFVSLDARYV